MRAKGSRTSASFIRLSFRVRGDEPAGVVVVVVVRGLAARKTAPVARQKELNDVESSTTAAPIWSKSR